MPAPDLNAALRRMLPTAPANWLDDTPSDGAQSSPCSDRQPKEQCKAGLVEAWLMAPLVQTTCPA